MAQFFRPRAILLRAPSHSLVPGIFHARAGSALDQVLAAVFRAPRSYTGEDSVEISCHGNPRIAARILEELLGEARLARPGEFTLRALLNGKLDLAQAEAVNDLISASGAQAETAALTQLRGLLSRQLRELLEAITDARLRCELAIDFADQDLPLPDMTALQAGVEALLDRARALHSEGAQGRLIREGIRVCLAGPPNSGKSSLFNAFLKYNRALVSPHPGTTRDYLEETVSLQGYALVLYDTAGLRASPDGAEQAGIERSRGLMRAAALVLYLTEILSAPPQPDLTELPPELQDQTIWLASKADLAHAETISQDRNEAPDGSSPWRRVPVSALAPGGMDALQAAILSKLSLPLAAPDRPLVTNSRHLAALRRCIEGLEGALEALRGGSGFEFAAFELGAASSALEEILGFVSPDDLLERIFSSFCIGK